jgi:hypothetical protein
MARESVSLLTAALFLERRLRYDGSQMRPQWAYRTAGVSGDSIVAFEGPCGVSRRMMLDLEDLQAGAVIRGPHMLHWIAEHFDMDLEKAVLRQRLLAGLVREELERRLGKIIARRGDDLYDGGRKLTISIAAPTGVSAKIHFAINVARAAGVGVRTEGLASYKIAAPDFGRAILKAYQDEMESVRQARCKARPVS